MSRVDGWITEWVGGLEEVMEEVVECLDRWMDERG